MAETCNHTLLPLLSSSSWSKSQLSIIHSAHSRPCLVDSILRSAASPVRCCEFFTPPTRRLTSLDLYPLFTTIGLPTCSLSGCNTSKQRYLKFSLTRCSSSPALGQFLSPCLSAVADLHSSSIVKFFDSLILSTDFIFIH